MRKILFSFLSSLALLQGILLPSLKGMAESNSEFNQTTISWFTDYKAAQEESSRTNKPLLLLFTGTQWCPACVHLERSVLKHHDFAKNVGNQFVFLRAEFPSSSNESMMASPYAKLLTQYQIELFPTIVITDAKGKELSVVHYLQGGVQAYIQELKKAAK